MRQALKKSLIRAMQIATILLALVVVGFGQAKETVLYNFGSSPTDGTVPAPNLVFDSSGNIYGSTYKGGVFGYGTIFELVRGPNGTWTENVIYNFTGNNGANPTSGVIFDSVGNLYGTASAGGGNAGTVFELMPSSVPGGEWTATTLWTFGGEGDGAVPIAPLTWDQSGSLYGSTAQGGAHRIGTIFKISPPAIPGVPWTENILHSFECDTGCFPSGVVFDASGNLFGTTKEGGVGCPGQGCGTAFELAPTPQGEWTHTVILYFTKSRGTEPSQLVIDHAGSLYGTVYTYGPGGRGGAFRLTNNAQEWDESMVPFTGPGLGPAGGVLLIGKSAYGALPGSGQPQDGGYVFKITGKTKTVLYNFCSQTGCPDGSFPYGPLAQRGGKLYGIATSGGAYGQGLVYSLGP